ncbi:MAG TPA: methyltransferase domain-containing protein [Terriglobales bacterium]|nr:methyltransferase domain-containing protein [Terriglobales bacterium]
MSTPGKDWDGAAYQRLSDPQFRWGMKVLERVGALRGDETVLDVGCGSGRLTAELLERVPRGRVLANDASASMLEQARQQLARFGERVEFIPGSALDLQLDRVADLGFSTATFHWILDHDQLFRVLYRALKPGGRVVAQCGGGPNLHWIRARGEELMNATRFKPFFREWKSPWLYAGPEETTERLKAAGFVAVEAWLESTPTPFDTEQAYRAFTEKVVMRPYLQAITDEARRAEFMNELTALAAKDDPPYTLDYWRMNINARKA